MTRPNVLILIFAVMTFLPAVATAAPLHDASSEGNIPEVKRLLKAGADVNAKDEYGYMPLLFAISNGHVEVVKVLLSAGADVNARHGDGKPPLSYAISKDKAEVVKVLLSAGADVNAEDNDGQTPLDWAWGNAEVVKILKAAGGKESVAGSKKNAPSFAKGVSENPSSSTGR